MSMGQGQQPVDIGARLKEMRPPDWAVLVGAFLTFLFSLFPFEGVDIQHLTAQTLNGWHGISILSDLLMLGLLAFWVVKCLGILPALPLPAGLVAAGVAGFSGLLDIIHALTLGSILNLSYGIRVGGVLLILVTLATAGAGVWALQTGPAAAPRPPQPQAYQPPPPGYQQPPQGYQPPPPGYQQPPAGYPAPPTPGYQQPPAPPSPPPAPPASGPTPTAPASDPAPPQPGTQPPQGPAGGTPQPGDPQ